MLKKIRAVLAVAVIAVIAVLGLAATKPNTFRVERTVTVNAAPEKIFPLINDLREQNKWSPWDKKDPAMKRTFSGATKGVGAVYEWDGNKEIGAGRMEIMGSVAPSRVVMKLDFIRPMEGHNIAALTLDPRGPATAVTWSIRGPMPFVSKVMCVFMDMDKMIGVEFEKGLADLKILAEK